MNLDQSPSVFPVLSSNLPCLLRGGTLWMDEAPLTTAEDVVQHYGDTMFLFIINTLDSTFYSKSAGFGHSIPP